MKDVSVPDLTGKLAVVTGASDGLRLAQRAPTSCCRSATPSKAVPPSPAFRSAVPGVAVSIRQLDLASLDSVPALADQLNAEGRRIEILVENAGVMAPATGLRVRHRCHRALPDHRDHQWCGEDARHLHPRPVRFSFECEPPSAAPANTAAGPGSSSKDSVLRISKSGTSRTTTNR